MQSASVDAQDGTDPRDRALAVLRRERVLAALRDASATWRGGGGRFPGAGDG